MSWSWSQNPELYQLVCEQIHQQDRTWLESVYAEWKAAEGEELNEDKYASAVQDARDIPDDILADFVWEKTRDLANWTDGGFDAWCCPFGCGSHKLRFSYQEA